MKYEKRMVITFPFRAFHNQRFDFKTSLFIILPILFNVITLYSLNYITDFWGQALEYALPNLGYDSNIIYNKYSLAHVHFLLPSVNIEANLPDVGIWLISNFLILAMYCLSFYFSDEYTPLKYFLRVFLVLIFITLLYMLFFPNGFMYTIFFYTKSGFMQIMSLLFVIPWIYLFTYYFFGYRFVNKIIITCTALIYFIILAPFQYLFNACLIHIFSLMLMPPLFFYAGLMINLLAIIAFCSYGISIEPTHAKFNK